MYFETLEDFSPNFTNTKPGDKYIHSEYRYGDCDRPGIKFYTHVHKDSLSILGKLIVRGWLDIRRIPICVILRARSFYYDQLRSTSFPFQFCVPRIAYCHSHKRYRYYYYEWYIPYNFDGGMEWDLYFYGSPSMTW
ncbi:unnamed protein product [Arctia plantaginis]|uniref:Uncharacterized protein n=1 Tax=Arctia plantaginis TaxID=874455 RepID=A0A8S1BIH7_ARCPL|nr:unnamed protein product [Arctia plantaginis]